AVGAGLRAGAQTRTGQRSDPGAGPHRPRHAVVVGDDADRSVYLAAHAYPTQLVPHGRSPQPARAPGRPVSRAGGPAAAPATGACARVARSPTPPSARSPAAAGS